MNIKQHTLQNGERLLLVPVQEEACNFDYHKLMKILVFDNKDTGSYMDFIQLPMDGNWQLIGISDEITEEQAKELVLTRVDQSSFPTSMEYYNYLSDRMVHLSFDLDTALESFQSLLQSLGCEGRYAVLKEVKR